MVTRPLMDSIASITRPSWRNGVGSTHWLRQAKRTIMSGMGGCSSCRLDWGIHSLHGARSPCLMWVDDAVGLSHLRFGEGIVIQDAFLVLLEHLGTEKTMQLWHLFFSRHEDYGK